MKKWFQKTAALLLCFVLLLSAGCQAKQEQEQEPLLYVNGEAVPEEELALLDGDITSATRMKTLQQWTVEMGLISSFSYEALMEELVTVNQQRQQTKEQGGVIYGVTEYSPLQYYNITMGEYERMLREAILESTTQEELRAWYEANLENYRLIGEITAQVTVRSDGQVVNEQEVVLTYDTYRSLSEQDEQLVAVLETMYPGQETDWINENGLEWTAVCISREPDTYQPFEDVQGAVGEQYAAEQLRLEWERRFADSIVEDLRENDSEP